MNEIRIAVLNPHDRVLTFLDNTHRNSMHYWNDELHEYLQGTATVSYTHLDVYKRQELRRQKLQPLRFWQKAIN